MDSKPVETVLKKKKIYEVINPKLIQGTPNLTVREAIGMMQQHRVGYIVIAEKKKVVGIFTEVDVVRRILGQDVDWSHPVSEFMTKDPMVLKPRDSVGKAIELMGERLFYHIPLVDEKKDLMGVLSVRSLIRFLAAFYPTEIYNLPPDPDQVMETPEGG